MRVKILLYFSIIIALLFVSFALAITASIGNSRMVLRLSQGETIEKSILVKNVNDIPVTIDLIASGELENSINLREESFSLMPKEEKKAYFTITASKANITETKINVKFTPPDGTSVGLSSTIIVIPNEISAPNLVQENENDNAGSPIILFLTISTIILIALLILLFIYSRRKSRASIKSKKSNNYA